MKGSALYERFLVCFFFFFFEFLYVSEYFESIETHFFFKNFRKREARNACERDASAKREARGSEATE